MNQGKLNLKNGVMKKPKVELPDEFMENCKSEGKSSVAYIAYNENFIVIGNDDEKMTDNNQAIASLVGSDTKQDQSEVFPFKLIHATENPVLYKDFDAGLFEWCGIIFFKTKKTPGRCIFDGKSLLEKAREEMPSEVEVSIKNIAETEIYPLIQS